MRLLRADDIRIAIGVKNSSAAAEQRRQPRRQHEADRAADERARHQPGAEPVVEGDAPLGRHQRQEPHAFDPDADRGEMHRQQQIALADAGIDA